MATPCNILMAYNIRRLREAKNLTVKVLAEHAGLSANRVEIIERGDISDEMRLREIDDLIEVLKCQPAELLVEVGPICPPAEREGQE